MQTLQNEIILKLDEALNKPNLSEAWYQDFMQGLILLNQSDKRLAEDYLDSGIKVIKKLILSGGGYEKSYRAPEELFSELEKGGAQINKILGCFVLTDPKDEPIIKSGSGTMREPSFAPKTAKVIEALLQNKIFADDMVIYRGGILDGMMRSAPYTLIDIPKIGRQIAVSDQIGEVTLFSTKTLHLSEWAGKSKSELKQTESVYEARYRSNPEWASNLLERLLKDHLEKKIEPDKLPKAKLPRKSDKPLLTEEKIAEWVKTYHEKVGKYPTEKNKDIWEIDGNGDYIKVENENWKAISACFDNGGRGLKKYTSFAKFKNARGLTIDKTLTEEKIIELVKIFYEKEGRYPTTLDKDVWERDGKGGYVKVEDENWTKIHHNFRKGHRGLNLGLSFDEFKEKHGFVIDRSLTNEKIVESVKIFFEKEKRYPVEKDKDVWERDGNGGYAKVEDETWKGIASCLFKGNRGLDKGERFGKWKKQHGLVTPNSKGDFQTTKSAKQPKDIEGQEID
jgi:hypothetical protein